jgi:hypothetical protein
MLGSVRRAMERRGRFARGCFLPVDARDDYLRAIAEQLADVEVLQAVAAVLGRHRADRLKNKRGRGDQAWLGASSTG